MCDKRNHGSHDYTSHIHTQKELLFLYCYSEPLNLGHAIVQNPTLHFNPFTWGLNMPI